jgi:SPP1 gp7 family putative phage head morphogenesis protein
VIPLLTPAPALRGTRLAEGPPAEAPAHEPAAPWRPLDPLEERADLSEVAATFERGAAALATAAAGPLARLRATLRAAAGRLARRRAPAAVAALTVPAARRRALAAALTTALRALWDGAQDHARRALPPGAPAAHAEARGLIGRTAEQYLRARAQTLADGIVDDAMSRTRAFLLGVLTRPEVPPLREILFLLDQALDTELPPEEAAGAPPRPTPARLETLWRTAAADAIGHARFAVFTDPELRGFVRAFRYTAVLDARTRAHHRAWDGVTLAVDDPTWYGPPDRRPPNGWNCRCTLIPVTAVDAVALTPHGALPSVSPVDPGFK